LQKFHHVGAVFACWFGVVTRSNGLYLFVVLNSFVHTGMYLYYALSVWGFRFPFKEVITMMQMIQFVVGELCLVLQLVFYRSCLRGEDIICSLYVLFYVLILLLMFIHFYKTTYNTPKSTSNTPRSTSNTPRSTSKAGKGD